MNIIDLCEFYLQQNCGGKKYVLQQLLQNIFDEIINIIIKQVRRPQDIVYYKNEFTQIVKQKLTDSTEIALHQAQI